MRKKIKFREIPWTSVFCFFAEKIKFREIPWTSVFRFFAEFRILFRIPFLRGKKLNSAEFRIPFLREKNQIPWNFAEFRIPLFPYSVFTRKKSNSAEFRGIPYSVFRVPYLFRIFPQNSAKNTKRKRRNSGEFRAEFFKNFDGIYFRYGTKFGFPVQH